VVISRRQAEHDSSVQICAAAGSIRVEAPSLFSDGGDAHLEDFIKHLFQLPAVEMIDVDRCRQWLIIEYSPSTLTVDAALRTFSVALQQKPCGSALDHVLQRASGSVTRVERTSGVAGDDFVIDCDGCELGVRAHDRRTVAHLGRVHRLVNLALGGASFVMSVIGIMTPFVPTMPFVLATGYFLANSSPTLHDLFRRSPLFGEMLTDWEERGGWRLGTKLKLFALMAFLWGATLAIAGFSWPLVIIMGLMSSISIVTILRVRTVSDESPTARLLSGTA
jgi:hypothetical protein